MRLSGVDVRDLSFDSIRETLGMVTRDGHLSHDTVRENLRFAGHPWRRRGFARELVHAAEQQAAKGV